MSNFDLADVCGESVGELPASPLLSRHEHGHVEPPNHSPANSQPQRLWIRGNPLHCQETGVWRWRFVCLCVCVCVCVAIQKADILFPQHKFTWFIQYESVRLVVVCGHIPCSLYHEASWWPLTGSGVSSPSLPLGFSWITGLCFILSQRCLLYGNST